MLKCHKTLTNNRNFVTKDNKLVFKNRFSESFAFCHFCVIMTSGKTNSVVSWNLYHRAHRFGHSILKSSILNHFATLKPYLHILR